MWKRLGAGLVTGAADDDPSGIATYSQAGAQFGFQLGWTLLLTYPLMVVIQAISARIGRTTGKGIAGNLRAHFPSWLVLCMVTLLFVANTLNIGADLGAMAESGRLMLPALPGWLYVVVFGVVCTLGQMYINHTVTWQFSSGSRFRCSRTLQPCVWRMSSGRNSSKGCSGRTCLVHREFWLMVVAILGTTISPYLFFWQAAQEVEDTKAQPAEKPLRLDPAAAPRAFARIKLDTVVGMGLSNLVALAIVATAAATLHKAGITEVTTAAQAAQALEPLAGKLASALFCVGIIGTGLLSIPVLAGSAAYALGEVRGWPVGLARTPQQAKAFYAAIAVATLLGAAANAFHLNPVKALVWAAVLNGIVAVPVMVLLMLVSTSTAVMGRFRISRTWAAVGWTATAVMGIASTAFIVAMVRPAQ